jgi:hypothetical protein
MFGQFAALVGRFMRRGTTQLCEECKTGVTRRTKCICGYKLCSWCYQTHKDANAVGDDCYPHMLSLMEMKSERIYL